MAGKKRPSFKFKTKYVYIAVIVISVLVSGKVLFDDVKKSAKETGIVSEIAGSPAEQIITGFQEVGKAAKNVDDFDAIKKALTNDKDKEDEQMFKTSFVRAKDGDTYVVKSENGEEATVRLIGVDTPESVAPESYGKENTEEGKEVSDIVKDKLHEGDTVYLEFDVSSEDKYGRMLAYVYLEDGTMMQDWLLENGYAKTMTIQPNSKYAEHFAEIQHKAAENKVGLWNGFFEE